MQQVSSGIVPQPLAHRSVATASRDLTTVQLNGLPTSRQSGYSCFRTSFCPLEYSTRLDEIRFNHLKPMPRRLFFSGLVLLAGALPLAIRLTWEMTLLTWQRGPQMIGFTLMHTYGLVAVVGGLFWLGSILWLSAVIVGAGFRRFRLRIADGILISVATIILACPAISYSVWQSMTEAVLGTSPAAPRNMLYAASIGDLSGVKRFLKQGVNPDSQDERGYVPLFTRRSQVAM